MSQSASFGYRDVPLEDKQGLVDDVFHRVAGRYDLMNDAMSVGVHRLWKQAFVSWLAPRRSGPPYRVLDMAGGSGDIATRICRASKGHAKVTVADINASMLAVGRDRAKAEGLQELEFVQANAEELPFGSASFDAYVIAFGIRNVPRIDRALGEARRVLRHGGRFLCLEFAPVDMPGLDRLYDAWSFNVIPPLGAAITGDSEPYRYLVESIRRFPRPQRFETMIREAGLERVEHRLLSGGIVAIHSGWKL